MSPPPSGAFFWGLEKAGKRGYSKDMERIVERLDTMNSTLEKMLDVMKKPVNKFFRALEIIGLGVGILSVLNAIDIIRSWVI
jgi:hypothetical protein